MPAQGQLGTQAASVSRPNRWPLIIMPTNRAESVSTDARLVNGYMEKELQGDTWIYKRPGLARLSTPSGGPGLAQGCYNWNGDIYAIVDGHLYKNGVDKGGTINTTNGTYRFSSTMGSNAKLVFGNGVKAFAYNATDGLQDFTSEANFPTPFRKGWAYLDGTMYVLSQTDGATISGSEINDPIVWPEDNTVIAQIEPSNGIALAKQLVYVICLKENSTEIFFDAANATGSPLGRVQGAKLDFGCISQDSVRELDGSLFWLCTNASAAVQIMKMTNLRPEIISTPAIERLLESADFTTVYSWTLKLEGHRWYAITLVNNNLTLIYDLMTGLWAQWTDSNGDYLPIVDSTYLTPTAQTILQHESDGYLYTVSPSNLTDNGEAITMDIYTPNYDSGSGNRKQLQQMLFDVNQVGGSVLQVRRSDDDYRTWSNFRYVDCSVKRPALNNEGTFKRRAYNFRHQSPTPFRIHGVDLRMDEGTL